MYLETIDLLYSVPDFDFKGTTDMLIFKSIIPPIRWQTIRSISISTLLLAPPEYCHRRLYFHGPPEDWDKWIEGCKALTDLPNLRKIYLDITMLHKCDYGFERRSHVDDDSFLRLLLPLKDIRASNFTVELNWALRETVMDALGPVKFEVKLSSKLHDHYFE